MNLIKLDFPFLCLILHLIIPSLTFPPLTIETPSPAATFNTAERPTANGTLLMDTPRNFSHPGPGSTPNEAIGNVRNGRV